MNITLTNPSYAYFKSIQSISSSWHGFSIFRSGGLRDIYRFILAKLQCGHWTVLGPRSFTPRELAPNICKLIEPGCPILACHSISSSIDASLGSREVSLLRRIVVKTIGGLSFISSITCWRAIYLRVTIFIESLFLNNISLMVFQWIPLSIKWEIETRLVVKSEQYATFLSLKVLPFFSRRATSPYPRMRILEIPIIR